MEFNIHDRVQIKDFNSLTGDRKNRNWGKVCGKVGVVVDKLFSEVTQMSIYKILLDGATAPSSINFTADMLESFTGGGIIEFSITIENNLVIARMYQNGKEVRYNHAHIFHEGLAGVAQAVSYACKRLSMSFNENQNTGGRQNEQH